MIEDQAHHNSETEEILCLEGIVLGIIRSAQRNTHEVHNVKREQDEENLHNGEV